jgi:hypothetical protein
MNTKLAYRIQSVIDYASLDFDPDDPELLPDGMYQYPIFAEIFHVLDSHLDSLYPQEEVFRSSNTFICYDPSNLNRRVGPDFYAALGVDAPAIMERKLYLPWEAGKPPDFVLEVGSESTGRQDTTVKRRLYAEIGIPEYWRFGPSGGDFHGEPLAGDRLVDGLYQPVDLTTEPDGILKGYSPVMRLSLCWREGMLKFFNRETAAYLSNFREERAARETAEAELHVAEARIRQLEQELRRRPRQNQ